MKLFERKERQREFVGVYVPSDSVVVSSWSPELLKAVQDQISKASHVDLIEPRVSAEEFDIMLARCVLSSEVIQ